MSKIPPINPTGPSVLQFQHFCPANCPYAQTSAPQPEQEYFVFLSLLFSNSLISGVLVAWWKKVEKMEISLKYVKNVKEQLLMVIILDIKKDVKVLNRTNNKKFMYAMYAKNKKLLKTSNNNNN